jgi:shikimate dehydrogenase
LKKHKLALLGKNISHSKSPEIYNELLNNNVIYKLLDISVESQIPTLNELFKQFDGISITSPYKEHFVSEVKLIGDATKLGAVNCIRKNNDVFEGINTDYLAMVEIFKSIFQMNAVDSIIVLGDGVMSRVAAHALNSFDKKYLILSRKLTEGFAQVSLLDFQKEKKLLVINTCAREYVYRGELSKNVIFWDLNYNFKEHFEILHSKCTYIDGHDLLKLQAVFALSFWSIK